MLFNSICTRLHVKCKESANQDGLFFDLASFIFIIYLLKSFKLDVMILVTSKPQKKDRFYWT